MKKEDRKLPPDVDFDLYGHCCKCHKNMLVEEMVDGKIQIRLTGQHRTVKYLLDNGSQMGVTMCSPCVDGLQHTVEERDAIMKKVIAGWDIESDDLVSSVSKPHWTKRVKDQYMRERKKLSIVVEIGEKPQDVLLKELHGFLQKKGKV